MQIIYYIIFTRFLFSVAKDYVELLIGDRNK